MKTCCCFFLLGGLLGADFNQPDLSIREEPALEGRWKTAFSESNGRRGPWCQGENVVWEFSGNVLKIHSDGRQLFEGRYFLTAGPGTIDYRPDKVGANRLGIFTIKGDELTLCHGNGSPSRRPTSFATKMNPRWQVLVFRRVKQ